MREERCPSPSSRLKAVKAKYGCRAHELAAVKCKLRSRRHACRSQDVFPAGRDRRRNSMRKARLNGTPDACTSEPLLVARKTCGMEGGTHIRSSLHPSLTGKSFVGTELCQEHRDGRAGQNSCVGVHQLCCKASVMLSTTWFPCPCSHVKLVALSTCIDQPIKNMMQTDKASTVIVMKPWQDMLQKTCKTSEVQNFKTEHENCF